MNINVNRQCETCGVWISSRKDNHQTDECIRNLNKHEAQLKEELLETKAKLRTLQKGT